LEKAKTVARPGSEQVLPQAGEKSTVALAGFLVGTFLLGARAAHTPQEWLAVAALMGAATLLFVRYLLLLRRDALVSVGRVANLALLILLPLFLVNLLGPLWSVTGIAFLPLSFFSLVIALVWGRALALESTVLGAGLLGLYLLLRQGTEVADPGGLVICVAGALTACLAAGRIQRRTALVRVGITTGLVQATLAVAIALLGDGDVLEGLRWAGLLGVQGLVVGLLISGLLPAIEVLFQITTAVSLLELGNTHEQPLLRKLLIEAPGTFHHSYLVGLLAEAAAEAVGADALLTRVGALHHDIGKLNKPEYFAENCRSGESRHRGLTPEMSTLIISAHPRDGVELGEYYGLPKAVLNFMPEHHGTCLIEYFYHAAKERRGTEKVPEEDFRYPGPKPQRVETAIVMIADAVEAISRQMADPTRTRLGEMVHEVATKRLMDGQFSECGMTLSDLETIEAACLQVLMGLYHQRATFPKGGRAHPLDLSQPSEARRTAKADVDPHKASIRGEST
jgi:putative nucleotidyltransferase with HDIG domain